MTEQELKKCDNLRLKDLKAAKEQQFSIPYSKEKLMVVATLYFKINKREAAIAAVAQEELTAEAARDFARARRKSYNIEKLTGLELDLIYGVNN